MTRVMCQVVRWVSDEPQPGGLVEVHLTDAHGEVRSLVDETAVSGGDDLPAGFLKHMADRGWVAPELSEEDVDAICDEYFRPVWRGGDD